MGRGEGGGGCGGRSWHWALGIQSQDVKLGTHLRRGTVYGRGQPGVSGGRMFRGRRMLGQRQDGKRRRGMSIQYMGNGGRWQKIKQKVKEKGKGGEGIHFN